jgi:hypothetical protein
MIRPETYSDGPRKRPPPSDSRDTDVLDLVEAEFGAGRWGECVRLFLTTALVAGDVQADPRSFDLGFEMGVRCALRDPEVLRLYARATSYGRQCSGNLETDVKVSEAVDFIMSDGRLQAPGSA